MTTPLPSYTTSGDTTSRRAILGWLTNLQRRLRRKHSWSNFNGVAF